MEMADGSHTFFGTAVALGQWFGERTVDGASAFGRYVRHGFDHSVQFVSDALPTTVEYFPAAQRVQCDSCELPASST